MTETNQATSKPVAAPKYQRSARNILIHKPMQREMTFMLIALLMVSTLVVGYVIHSTIKEVGGGGGFLFGKISIYDVLSDLSYQLVIRVSAILFATMIVIGLFGVFFLHRVAGPVYRFRRTLLKLNEGEIPHVIKLREGDFFEETATELNQLIKQAQADKEKLNGILQKLEQIQQSQPSDKIAELLQSVRSLGKK